MEPESSLPLSKATATCAYPEPDQSILCLHIPLLLRSILRLTHLLLGLPSGLLLSGSPLQSPMCNSPVRLACHMPRPSHFFIYFITRMVFGEQYRSLSSSLCSLLHSPVTSSLFCPNILPQFV